VLLTRLQTSRLLRLVILSHQLDEARRQQNTTREQDKGSDEGNNLPQTANTCDESNTCEARPEAVITEHPIPEDDILNNYRDADPFLVKSVYKYWDGEASVWKSQRLGE
jgi:hypothetical protein